VSGSFPGLPDSITTARPSGCPAREKKEEALTHTKRIPVSLCLLLACWSTTARAGEMPWVQVAKDRKGFVLEPSGRPFLPWGFNSDHDDKGRLTEDYWEDEWATVEAHFGQMKELGANVVRVHLQLGRFMDGPDKPNGKALDRLGNLLRLAERLGLYLDL